MDIANFREFCLSLKGVTEDTPFDETTLCFRIGGKIFALSDSDSFPFACNMKCEPERAIELRERYEGIKPGWHMNKKHWNTVTSDGTVPDELFEDLARSAYELVLGGLPRKVRAEISEL